MTNDTAMLTVVEAAAVLRVSRNLAYTLVARGDLPAVRLGRVIRVPRAALEAWLEREAERPGATQRAAPPHRSQSREHGR